MGGNWATNVGNIDLSATAASGTTTWRPTKARLESAAHAGTALEASARSSRVAESRLGLSVFANVYESSHEVLVA